MKTQNGLICILAAAVSVLTVSCSKVKPSYNRENLKGTWVVDIYDGVKADPSGWTVQTFTDNSTLTVNGVKDTGDGDRTWDQCSLPYEAYCCDMSYHGTVRGFFGIPVSATLYREYAFISSEDSLVTLEITSEKLNGTDIHSGYNRITMRKIPTKYAVTDSLVGIWQTSSRDGETFESWRMMFESSNKFTMSVQNEAGIWKQVGEDTDTYSLYYDFIALTLRDNLYIGTEDCSDVAFFTGLTAMPKASYMSFECGGHTYTFTYVSSLN